MLIIPKPKRIVLAEGVFKLSFDTEIVLDGGCAIEDFDLALSLRQEIESCLGIYLNITKSNTSELERNKIIIFRKERRAQAYEINISESQVRIYGCDAGLMYACQTLRQIFRSGKPELPCALIEDQPDFMNRGFYYDVTRGKVPKLETLYELADRAAFYKINQIQLYIEHSFLFKEHSEIWRDSDPITAEEILALDRYCRQRYVELVPSLSTFGHLYKVLTSRKYHHLSELEVELDRPFSWRNRMHHHTLNVSDPESFTFVQKILDEYIPLFSSNKFNICCDETFDLGKGKSKGLLEERGAAELYSGFLNKIVAYVKKYDKEIQFWGDVIIQHPEILKSIPDELICLNWNYDKGVTDHQIRLLSELRRRQYVCPGVWGWNRLMNDFSISDDNISRMIRYGREHGAEGVLNTDWGDYGHLNLFGNSMPGMILGADLSWNSGQELEFEIKDREISSIEYGDASGELIKVLKIINDNQLVIWEKVTEWIYERFDIDKSGDHTALPNLSKKYGKEDIVNANEILQAQMEKLLQLKSVIRKDRGIDVEEFMISARGIQHLNLLLLVLREYDNKSDYSYRPEALAEEMEYWLQDYSGVWRKRNKESELFRIKEIYFLLCNILRDMQREK